MESLEFLDLLLEHADVVHEGHDAVGGHWTGVEAGGGQQRGDVQGHRALGRVQHEQLAPGQPQQRHLYTHTADTHGHSSSDVTNHVDSYSGRL